MLSPNTQYQQRLAARQKELAGIELESHRYWRGRRFVFIIIVILIILAVEGYLHPVLIGLPVIAFLVLMIRHQSVRRREAHYRRAVGYYEAGLARLEHRWAGGGVTGEDRLDPHHPYAGDLDIFGRGSLFELLCQARTRAGESRLASWLLSPADPTTIRVRQQLVTELRDNLDLREDLALLGEDVRSAIDDQSLISWSEGSETPIHRLAPVIAFLLGLATFSSIVLWFAGGYREIAMAAIFAESIFLFIYRQRVATIVAAIDRPGRELRLLAGILARIEREEPSNGPLTEIRRRLEVEGEPPSRQIERLSRLVEVLDSTRNQVFAPFAYALLIPAQLAFSIERWRMRSGRSIHQWIDAVAELEALSSLAGFAFENPEHVMPDIVTGGARFEATALGHPLLPYDRCVRNDITLGESLQALIVSGSNMSGKSTMMRTIGINAVLAFAGAPVRATRLCLTPLALGASIQIQDSLQGGASRFYAEITRLKQIVELTRGAQPLLFLLDEILSGTNSHDRRIGAEAIIRGLLERGAIGMTTTHDLALTKMVEALGGRAANVHFEDQLTAGKMSFDYRMHPGVVTHSNALELMRSIGLEV